MGAFLAYTIYSGVFLLFLFLFYKLLLSNEKQITLNRIILLSCYALAFAAWPLSQLVRSLRPSDQSLSVATITLEDISLNQVGIAENASSAIPRVLIWIYLAGASLVLLKTLFSIVRLLFYIKKGRTIRKEDYTLVVMPDKDMAPFSFGRKIVMSAADYETVRDLVTAHELAHIQCHHYLDLIVAQAVCVVIWYNPAAWLMRDELKLLHEYQADAKVIDRGVDNFSYQMLLIRKTAGKKFHTLANSLNHSKLKDRIAMMQKEKSVGVRRMRVFGLLIAPAVAFGVMNLPAVASDLKSLETVSLRSGASAKDAPQIEAEFPGGEEKLAQYLYLNVRYPQRAQEEDRTGKSVVGFTIQADGTITDVNILEGSWPDLDEEAVRVVKEMPKWEPATTGGKPVASRFSIPINFKLQTIEGPKSDKQTTHPYFKLNKEGEAKLVVGPSNEKDCDAREVQAFRVDGKLLTESMTIDMSDIESYKNYPPSAEFPGGLCDIKLKKK